MERGRGMTKHVHTQVWINAARRGDELAISKLLAGFHPVLRARAESRMSRAMKQRYEPEDLLQQTYLEVFRGLGRVELANPDAFLAWVRTILDHKLIDADRTLHRQRRDVDREQPAVAAARDRSYLNLLDQLYAESSTPSRIVRHDEALDALGRAMTRLSDDHRCVIQWRFIEGRPLSAIAADLDRSEDAVVKFTRRALDALREEMDRFGEFTREL
jgi:RNA polymerase sigma-70 factor (subfamily 1)